jgi:hypothetical protein
MAMIVSIHFFAESQQNLNADTDTTMPTSAKRARTSEFKVRNFYMTDGLTTVF